MRVITQSWFSKGKAITIPDVHAGKEYVVNIVYMITVLIRIAEWEASSCGVTHLEKYMFDSISQMSPISLNLRCCMELNYIKHLICSRLRQGYVIFHTRHVDCVFALATKMLTFEVSYLHFVHRQRSETCYTE